MLNCQEGDIESDAGQEKAMKCARIDQITARLENMLLCASELRNADHNSMNVNALRGVKHTH